VAINPITGLSDTEMVPTENFRWFAPHRSDTPVLQQAWAPRYGGRIEWRYVPVVYGTDGVAPFDGGQQK
jgi:hypothetical protein